LFDYQDVDSRISTWHTFPIGSYRIQYLSGWVQVYV